MIIIVIALVLVGVVVGAAVGVTQSKKGSTKDGAVRDPNGITQAPAASSAGGGGIVTGSGTLTPSLSTTAS